MYKGEKTALEGAISVGANVALNISVGQFSSKVVSTLNLNIPVGLNSTTTSAQKIASAFFDSYTGTNISSHIGNMVSFVYNKTNTKNNYNYNPQQMLPLTNFKNNSLIGPPKPIPTLPPLPGPFSDKNNVCYVR